MKAKKSLGQNFLNNDTIINNIVSLFDCTERDLIIEIGPGRGALTKKLVNKKAELICIEIDTDLKEILLQYQSENCHIYFQDILKADLHGLIKKEYENIYVIGNLPYYITSPIIEKLIESKINFRSMYFMVQKEVADRFSALPGSKDYGYMTVYINHYYDVQTKLFVGRKNFSPIPNVDSAVIGLNKKNPIAINNETKYFNFVKECFKLKRKTLKNNLKNYNSEKVNAILKKYNFSESTRAEQLPAEVFIELYNQLI